MKYLAGDINESIIEMWKAVQGGWIPPTDCSEEEYDKLRHLTTVSSAEKGFIGHSCSFGGQYFSSFKNKYLHGVSTEQKQKRIAGQSDRVVRIGKEVTGVDFSAGDYEQFDGLRNYVIYCDPPYDGSTNSYYTEDRRLRKFEHDNFWDWCRKIGRDNIVFVSGYNVPDDFLLVWGANKKDINGPRVPTGIEGLYLFTGKSIDL